MLLWLTFLRALTTLGQAEKEAERKGEVTAGDAFDSNCITPGTPFMERLGAHVRFFIRRKIADDPAWRGPTIVFSGALLLKPLTPPTPSPKGGLPPNVASD